MTKFNERIIKTECVITGVDSSSINCCVSVFSGYFSSSTLKAGDRPQEAQSGDTRRIGVSDRATAEEEHSQSQALHRNFERKGEQLLRHKLIMAYRTDYLSHARQQLSRLYAGNAGSPRQNDAGGSDFMSPAERSLASTSQLHSRTFQSLLTSPRKNYDVTHAFDVNNATDTTVVTPRHIVMSTNAPVASEAPDGVARQRNDRDRSWLGPPNSLSPDKRSQHVVAVAKKKRSKTKHSANSRAATNPNNNNNPDTSATCAELNNNDDPTQTHHLLRMMDYYPRPSDVPRCDVIPTHVQHDEDDDDASLYATELASDVGADDDDVMSGDDDAQQQLSDSWQVQGPQVTSGSHASNATHLSHAPTSLLTHASRHSRLSNLDDVTMTSERFSARGDMTPLYNEVTNTVARATSLQQHDRRVHFDPSTRDVTRENRSAPVPRNDVDTDATAATLVTSQSVRDSNVNRTVDSLPAVVEKFTIKSLPVLPQIQNSRVTPGSHKQQQQQLNLSNANIIYIKEEAPRLEEVGGESTPRRIVAKPILIAKNSVINVARRPARGGGAPSPRTAAGKPSGLTSTVTPLTSVTEETNVPASPVPRHDQLPSNPTSQPNTAKRHPGHNQSSQPSSVSRERASQHKAVSTKATSTTSSNTAAQHKRVKKSKSDSSVPSNSGKKGAVVAQKGNKTGQKPRKAGRSSGSSSRNSPSVDVDSDDSDVTDEADIREQRLKAYAAAMRQVSERMREFDKKFGKNANKGDEVEEGESMLGKAIPRSNNKHEGGAKAGRKQKSHNAGSTHSR